MYKDTLDGFNVGNTVAIKGIGQRMTITHLETRIFKDNVCELIYQLPDGKMNILGNVPIKTIKYIKE